MSASVPRLPTRDQFPPAAAIDIIPPSTGSPINILLLLHGLGDTNKPFTSLGKNLNLPETACLSIQGFNPVPAIFTGSEHGAFHWGDDVIFDQEKGDLDLDAGFTTTSRNLLPIITQVLMTECQFPARNILFLGFGQGGMAALQIAADAAARGLEFGGIISVGGRLPSSSTSIQSGSKCRTPVLLCGGSRSTEITRSAVDAAKAAFVDVEYVKWQKAEDSMPANREEMLPLMKFFARRLRSRAGVPEGAAEV